MSELLVVALAGFLASLVDGALGMGFGPTSASILLSAGVSPTATSASINIAKVATGVASALAHGYAGNVRYGLVARLAVPGAVGAVVGALLLTSVDTDVLRVVLAVVLIAVGVRIVVRFSTPLPPPSQSATESTPRGLIPVATAGGVTNGLVGAWGPVVTPFLLHSGVAPRFAVGCVNAAEVAVAVVSVGTLLATTGGAAVSAGVVVAMLAGGVLAAPVAARIVGRVPARPLGLAVALLLLVTQVRALAEVTDLRGSRWVGYTAVAVAVAAAALRPHLSPALRRTGGG